MDQKEYCMDSIQLSDASSTLVSPEFDIIIGIIMIN